MRRRLIINGGRQPREFVLVGTLVVGRDPMCDVSESDPLLSRRHAEFSEHASDVIVRDLGSRNGILVNGVKRPEAILHGGDVVQVGHLQVRYVEDSTGPTADTAATVLRPADPGESVATVISGASPAASEPATVITLRPGEIEFIRFAVPGQRVSFELPASGWRAVGGGATTLAALAHTSGDASIVMERAARPEGVAGSGGALATAETKAIRDANPAVSKIDAVPFDDYTYTAAILNYARPGGQGVERVFQVSFVDGPALYRLTCSAAAAKFDSFEPIFTRAAATFDAGSSE